MKSGKGRLKIRLIIQAIFQTAFIKAEIKLNTFFHSN